MKLLVTVRKVNTEHSKPTFCLSVRPCDCVSVCVVSNTAVFSCRTKCDVACPSSSVDVHFRCHSLNRSLIATMFSARHTRTNDAHDWLKESADTWLTSKNSTLHGSKVSHFQQTVYGKCFLYRVLYEIIYQEFMLAFFCLWQMNLRPLDFSYE